LSAVCGTTAVIAIPAFTERKILLKISKASSYAEMRYCYELVLKLLQFEKLQPQTGETPAMFAERTDESTAFNCGFSTVMPAFEQLEFGSQPLSPPLIKQITDFTEKLYRKIVTEQKLLIRIARKVSVCKWKI
jgi:hypothetical protein